MQTTRDSSLDELRGLAICLVLFVHSGNRVFTLFRQEGAPSGEIGFGKSITDLGLYGVQVFFVLSGFLMWKLYSQSEHTKSSGSTFVKKRFLKVFPSWALFCLISYLLLEFEIDFFGWSTLDPETLSLSNLEGFLLSLTFTAWLFPEFWLSIVLGGWSIQTEVIFYVLFASQVIFRLISPRHIIWLLSTLQLLAVFPLSATFFDGWTSIGAFHSLAFFVLGSLWAQSKISRVSYFSILQTTIFTFPLTSAAFISAFLFSSPPFGSSMISIIVVLGAVSLVKVFENSRSPHKKILSSLGEVSYSMYFVHFFMVQLAVQAAPFFLRFYSEGATLGQNALYLSTSGLVFALTLMLSYPISRLLFICFERPISLGFRGEKKEG